jgi:predicted small lipoprotein YifL
MKSTCHRSLVLTLVTMTATGSLLAGLATLAGCGQKGPLTLAAPPSAKPPASSPSPAR